MAVKGNGRRKFPALYVRIARPDVLQRSWERVRSNKGASGIDGETLKAIEARGVEQVLTELRGLLNSGRHRPQATHRVYIPKLGGPRKGGRSQSLYGFTSRRGGVHPRYGLQLRFSSLRPPDVAERRRLTTGLLWRIAWAGLTPAG